MIAALYIAVMLIGYLVGSIPFGVFISRLSTKTDITQIGSGKMGTTNVLRTAGKKAAAAVLLLDMAKGALPVIFAGLIFSGDYLEETGGSLLWMTGSAQVLAALSAIAGHSRSIFLKFKGGRGVATFTGGLFAMCWPVALAGGALMILIGGLSRYMSLGSITGAVAAFVILIPLNIWNVYPVQYLIYTLIGAIFVIFMHRDNIRRLLAGTERKLGEKIATNNLPLPSKHNKIV